MLQDITDSWRFRLNKAQIGHYISCERYQWWNTTIGILSVLFSGTTTGLLLLDFNSLDKAYLKTIIIILSLLAALTTSLQTFLRLGDKAELHRSRASRYGSLKRSIELFAIKEYKQEELSIFLKDVESKWAMIAEDAPVTPKRIRQHIKNILKEEAEEKIK